MPSAKIGRDLTNEQVVRMVQTKLAKKSHAIQELEALARELEKENQDLRKQLSAANQSTGAQKALLDELEAILKGPVASGQAK